MDRSKVTGGFVDAALTFIKKAEADQKPFYVNVWPDDVHGPLYPPLDKWKDDQREKYMAVLENMDAQLEPLFDYIRDNAALRENTMILIRSDNGPASGEGRSFGMRGQKAMLYEAGVRSPLVIWAPGLKGAVIEEPTSNLYVLPWLLLEGDEAARTAAESVLREDLGPALRVTKGAVISEFISRQRLTTAGLVALNVLMIFSAHAQCRT